MTTSLPSISVVIPTYQRRDAVITLLTSLYEQTIPAAMYEVVVSIDGSEDGTREAIESLTTPYHCQVLWQPNSGRATACNAGILAACGSLVVLLDDDMEATPHFLEGHWEAHRAGGRQAVLGAVPIRYSAQSSPTLQYVGRKFNQHLARLAQPNHQFVLRDCYSGNFSIRRDLLLEVGLFDTAFKVYGNEDLELALRLQQAGITFAYSERACAYQGYDKSLVGLARDSANKGQTSVLFLEKHPEVVKQLKIGTYHQNPWRRKVLLQTLLTLDQWVPGFRRLLLALSERLSRLAPRHAFALYDLVLDYCYWDGVQQSLHSRNLSDRWSHLFSV